MVLDLPGEKQLGRKMAGKRGGVHSFLPRTWKVAGREGKIDEKRK